MTQIIPYIVIPLVRRVSGMANPSANIKPNLLSFDVKYGRWLKGLILFTGRNYRMSSHNTTRIIYIVAALAIVLTVAATCFFLVVDFNNRMMLARQQTQRNAMLYHDNVHLVMGSADSILNALENVLTLNPTSEELQQFLAETAAPFPMLRSLLVLNSDGIVIGDSRPTENMMGFDLSDRQVFTVFKNYETTMLFIDNPVQSRLNGEWVIPIGIGLHDSAQELQWVVLAAIEPIYLSNLEFQINSHTPIGLSGYVVSENRRILASMPYDVAHINVTLDTLIDLPALDLTTHADSLDNQITFGEFIIEHHAVEPYGISVIFVQDMTVALEPFYGEAVVLLLFAGLLIAGVLLIAHRQIALTRELTLQTEARQQTEADYRRIVETAYEGICQIDADERIVFANQRVAELLGYPIAELIGKSTRDMLFEEDHAAFDERLKLRRSHVSQQHEVRYKRKDGQPIWTLISSSPIFDASDNYLGSFAMVTDITERQQIEAALRESESRFRTLAENAPMYIWVSDNNKSVSYVNHSWLAFTGRTLEEELGEGWLERVHPDDMDKLEEKYPSHYDTWRAFRVEIRFRRFDDEYCWLLVQWTPRFEPAGVFVGYIGTGIDINQRKRVEDALRESEVRFRMLADNTPLFIWLVEPDKTLSYVNKAWLDFSGQTWQEGTGKGWLDVLHPDDTEWLSASFVQEFDKHLPFEVEARFRRHDGEYRWLLIKGIPRLTADGIFEGYVGSSVDITEQQRFAEELALQVQKATSELQAANEQLRESEHRYRMLADMSGAYSYSYSVTADGQIEYDWVTDAFTRISGYTLEELMTHQAGINLIFRDDAEFISLFRERLFEKPLQETIEYRMTCKSGEVKYMIAYVMSQWSEQAGRVVRVVGTAQDISRLKRAEAALREERNFLQSVMNTTPNGIVVFDLNRRITLANARAEQILKLQERVSKDTPHQFPGLEIRNVDGEPIPLERRPFAEVLKTKKASYGHEQILVSLDGERTPIVVHAAPLFGDDGEVEQVVFVFEDISQLKGVEEALRTERNFLQSIMDATPSGIIVLDIDSQITFANVQGELLMGIKRDADTGQLNPVPDWDVNTIDGQSIPTEERFSTRIRTTLKPVFGEEQMIMRADGQRIPIRANAVPQLGDDGQLKQIVYSFEDISLYKKWQQQIEDALKQEKELNDMKNRFVTLISHELRTPLSIIMTSAELLQLYHDKVTSEQIVSRTDRIQKQVMRLKRIMEDVSFINKTDMMGHQVQLTVVDLAAFCESIIEGVLLVEENKPQIIKHIEGAVTDIVSDETLLYQILVNLVSNAVKYTDNSGTVTLSCTVTNETITLKVEDTGMGIPAEDQKKLFQSFHRASNVSNIPGTGLGLDIIRRSVKAMEGEVAFTSEEGNGTTFTVTLPNLARKD